MIRLLAIYRQQFQTSAAEQLQYRAALVIWLLGLVIQPVVYLVVWTNVADASGGAVGGFTVPDFAAYFIAAMVVNHLTFTWHMWEYDFRIREGQLSAMLLRPLHPIHVDLAENVSYKTITLVVMVPTAVALVLIFRPALNPPAWSLVAFLPALVLAFSIQFLWGWALAMVAFWTTRVSAPLRIYFLGKLFLAGQLAPIALLPPAARAAASLTPFPWMLSFPVELLLGRVAPPEVWSGLAIQLLWTGLGALAVRIIWRAGVRRYAAFGG